jgi:hypothetical protein
MRTIDPYGEPYWPSPDADLVEADLRMEQGLPLPCRVLVHRQSWWAESLRIRVQAGVARMTRSWLESVVGAPDSALLDGRWEQRLTIDVWIPPEPLTME